MKTPLFCLAFLVLASISSAAFAQNEFLDLVESQLLDAAATFYDGGYEGTHGPYTGMLNQGGESSVVLTLDGLRSYRITAACDQDCSDVDLYLYDEYDNLIDSDEEYDDYPLVSVTPKRRGRFTAVVRMASCDQQPCYYGVRAFGN